MSICRISKSELGIDNRHTAIGGCLRTPLVESNTHINCLSTNTEPGLLALAHIAKSCGRTSGKCRKYWSIPLRVRSLVTPSATVRVDNEPRKKGTFFRFWPSTHTAINSLVSEIAQSEQNSTKPGKPEGIREGGRIDVVQGGRRLHLQSGGCGGFPCGDVACISAGRLTLHRETVAIARKRPARSIVLSKILTITREDGRWLNQGLKWANA